jgi:phage baseplate assembly protein W
MSGMSATTGRRLDDLAHLRQSIADILATPLGTRVMLREYGSLLPYRVDAPLDGVTVLDIIQATAAALLRWEPRVAVQRVAVRALGVGVIALDLDLIWRADGGALRLEGILIGPAARVAVPTSAPVRARRTATGAARITTAGNYRRLAA